MLGYLVGAGTEVLAFEPERRTTMTPLRQRMIDDMRLAGFAERTRDVYIQAVRRLAAHYKRSPDVLSEEDVRAYLLHLRDERGIARGTFRGSPHSSEVLGLAAGPRTPLLLSPICTSPFQSAKVMRGK